MKTPITNTVPNDEQMLERIKAAITEGVAKGIAAALGEGRAEELEGDADKDKGGKAEHANNRRQSSGFKLPAADCWTGGMWLTRST